MDNDSTYQEIRSYFFVTKPILFFKDKLCLIAGHVNDQALRRERKVK